MYRPREIELMLKQEDIHGKSVLQYIAELKLYRFLQINHVNRIVSQMWESKTDIGGSMFDLSSTYYLLFTNRVNYQEDNEIRRRFYQPRNPDERPMPHGLTYAVWKKSMSLRYAIESVIFLAVLCIFQYEISLFNKDLHLAMRELHEFELINDEIVIHGGLRYDPENPWDLHEILRSVQDEGVHDEDVDVGEEHRRSRRLAEFKHIENVDLSTWTLP